jgi:hypothetical protein
MPVKKTWLLRLPEIRAELTAMEVPVVDRAVFERVFGLRRRRAIQLLHHFGGWQAGRTFLVDRLSLLRQLEPLEASAEFALEQQRRQRLVDVLERLRRSRAGARVLIPVNTAADDAVGAGLPAGVQLERGCLRIQFENVEELLRKLYELSQAAANDFPRFRAAAEGNLLPPGSAVASAPAARQTA